MKKVFSRPIAHFAKIDLELLLMKAWCNKDIKIFMYIYAIHRMDCKNNISPINITDIESLTGWTKRPIQKALKDLEDTGYIVRVGSGKLWKKIQVNPMAANKKDYIVNNLFYQGKNVKVNAKERKFLDELANYHQAGMVPRNDTVSTELNRMNQQLQRMEKILLEFVPIEKRDEARQKVHLSIVPS